MKGCHVCLGGWSFCYPFSKLKISYADYVQVCMLNSIFSKNRKKAGKIVELMVKFLNQYRAVLKNEN